MADLAYRFGPFHLDVRERRLSRGCDVIPLRLGTLGQVISLGDVFLAVGLGRFLEQELRRPRRYFKRGAHAQPGSASKP